jgi:hypothetical protein
MSMFNDGAKFYTDSTTVYETTRNPPLMEVNNSEAEIERLRRQNKDEDRKLDNQEYENLGQDYALAEGLISIFKTDSAGRMIKRFETSFSTNLPYAPSKDGNMVLVQSNDHKTVSLAFFDPHFEEFSSKLGHDFQENEREVFKVMAWNLTDDDKLIPFKNLEAVN